MSSVTIPLYHYGLLKGYLAGQNAPSEMLVAVEALYMAAAQGPLRADALDAIQAVKEAAEKLAGLAVTVSATDGDKCDDPATPMAVPAGAEYKLPPLTRRALEKAAERTDAQEPSSEPMTDADKITSFLDAGAVRKCPPAHADGDDHELVVGPSEPKKRREWSPEARAAAADRMRARQAAGLMGKRKQESSAEPSVDQRAADEVPASAAPKSQPAPKPKQPPTIDPTRLITVHNSYAGKRQDGQLRDEDWPDIKSRMAKGDTPETVAGDYDASVEDLNFFIQSCQRREAKQPPGESRAPLTS